MNYSGNMPDWHQYNAAQGARTSSSSSSSSSLVSGGLQNGNNHVFLPGASSPALDGINLTSERHRPGGKTSTDGGAYGVGRNYGVGLGGMQLGGAHYGSAPGRNPMMDTLPPIGISVAPASVSDEVPVAHRSSQMAFVPGTSTNVPGSIVNPGSVMHPPAMGSQNSPIGSSSPGRGAAVGGSQAYVTCKAPCCNSDPNLYQPWDKYPHYGNSASAYRETMRQANGYPSPIDGRRYLPDVRKDCHESKEMIEASSYPGEHRGARHYTDYNKYGRKEGPMARAYPVGSGSTLLHQNYPMQSYQFPADYQKCPYSVKDYVRRGSSNPPPAGNPKNPAMMKYHEQQSVIVQQKYQHPKQLQYQNTPGPNNPGTLASTARPNVSNISPGLQGSFYNPNHPSRDYPQDYGAQDQSVVANRMAQSATSSHVHGTFQKYHVYHQKIAMQRFSLENHLRAFSRVPGYQTHPKYQECVMRYRELLRLQQTVDYQNIIQESPKVPSPSTALTSQGVPPINLQFDQNGMLINSSYMPSSGAYNSGISGPGSTSEMNRGEANKNRSLPPGNDAYDNSSNFVNRNNERILDHNERLMNHDPIADTLRSENADSFFVANEKKDDRVHEQPDIETPRLSTNDTSRGVLVANEKDRSKSPGSSTREYKNMKDFDDKPELDVRQFLANWDESEDEETATDVPQVTHESRTPEDVAVDSPDETGSKKNSPDPDTPAEKETPTEASVEEMRENANENEGVQSAEDMDDIPTIHIVENLESHGTELEKIQTVFGNLATAVLEPISICEDATEIEQIKTNDLTGTGAAIVLFEQPDKICSKVLEFNLQEGEEQQQQQQQQQREKIGNEEIVESVIASIAESVPLVAADSNVDDCGTSEDKDGPEVTGGNSPDDVLGDTATAGASTTTTTPTTSISSISNSTDSSSSGCETSSSNEKQGSNPTEVSALRKQNSFTSDESHNPDDISLPDLQTSECTPISTTLNTPIHSDSEESSEHVTDLTRSTNPIEIIQNSPIISFTHSPIKMEPYEQVERSRINSNSGTITNEHASLDFDFDEEVASNENRKYNENCDSSPESVVEELENQARDSLYEKRGSVPETSAGVCRESTEKTNDYYHDPLVGMASSSSSQNEKTSGLQDPSVSDENPTNGLVAENRVAMLERDSVQTDDFNHSDDLEKLCDMSLDGTCMIPLIPDDGICDEPRMPVSPMEGNCLTKILNDTLPITDLDMLDTPGNEIIDKSNGEDDVWEQVSQMDKDFEAAIVEPMTKKIRNVVKPTTAIIPTDQSNGKAGSQFEADKVCDVPDNNTPMSHADEKKSQDGDESAETFRDEVTVPEKSECRRTSKLHHIDSNLEIQVANFNVKIHNEVEKMMDEQTKSEGSLAKGVDAIEIKINLSRGEISRRNNKSLESKLQEEGAEDRKKNKNHSGSFLGKIRGRRRRRSMPEPVVDFESKRARRLNDDETSKRSGKYRRSRRFRRSMDDKLLLMNEEISCREHSTSSGSETNFRQIVMRNKETWARKIPMEMLDSRSTIGSQDDDDQDQMNSRIYTRPEKSKGLCRLPSPSYNSPMKSSATLDFDNFDVAPNHQIGTKEKSSFDDEFAHEKLRYEDEHRHKKSSNRYEQLTTGEAFETNLNTVPIYTTKDGRITYSPNCNYTYRALILEARQREKHSASVLRKLSHYSRSRNCHREATSRQKFPKPLRKSEAIKIGDNKMAKTKRTSGKLRHGSLMNKDVELKKYEYRRTEEKPSENRFNAEKPSEEIVLEQPTLEVTIENSRTVLENWGSLKTPETSNYASTKIARPLELMDNSTGFTNPHANNFEAGIVDKLFDGQELEISTRENNSPADGPVVSVERESCDSSLRFFRDNFEFPKITKTTVMASPSMRTVEKRPQIWDIDCQAALSDSGLESSTTYVEAAKESRKMQRWKNTFCDRVDKPKLLVSCDKKINLGTKYLSSENTKPFSQISKEPVPTKIKETVVQSLGTIPASANRETSEIFESLDLALPSCNQDVGEVTKKKRRRKKKKELDEARPKDLNESSDLFRRCVSNDSGEITDLLFQTPKLKDNSTNIGSAVSEGTLLSEPSEVAKRLSDTSALESETLASSVENNAPDTRINLSSCTRLLEAPSELTLATQLEDTATQFASESMDFSDVHPCANDDNVVYDKSDSYLDENAIDPTIDCSKKSDDSGKAPILTFSGQIQSDASFGDSCSKSPPNLTHENNWSEFPEVPIEKPSNEMHPKIPKMIIRNIRSRPGTPTSGEHLEEVLLSSSAKFSAIPYNQETRIDEGESKVPKLKIRLEDTNLPRVIPENPKHLRHDEKKMKSKKMSKSPGSPVAREKESLIGKSSRQSSEAEAQKSREKADSSSFKFTSTKKSSKHHHRSRSREKSSSKSHRSKSTERSQKELRQEKIPKLTIKKNSSPTFANKTVTQSPEDTIKQKCKTMSTSKPVTKKEEERGKRNNSVDESNNNNDSQQSLAEKVPKVIIKRASPSAEFKCELSKNDREAIIKDCKWQPEVKLRRFWVLDCMAKEPGNGQVALKVLESTLDQDDNCIWNDSGSQRANPRKFNEAKARRKSDCDLSKSEMLTSKHRRKSFESENIDFTRTLPVKELKKDVSDKIVLEKSQENNFEDNNYVIKIDSSDESQTTIEMLPVSPDNTQSELETKNQYFTAHGNMGKLYSEDAIPTQFELELEIVDNSSVDSLDVPIPSCSLNGNTFEEENRDGSSKKSIKSNEEDRGKKKLYKNEAGPFVANIKNMCCSDSLVKEVLAAKETLKRCLGTTRSKDFGKTSRPRPKTAAEKKQGSGYDYVVPEDCPNKRKETRKIAVSSEDKIKGPPKEKLASPQESDKKNSNFSPETSEETSEYEMGWKRSISSTSRGEVCKVSKAGGTDHFGENSQMKSIASIRTNASKFEEKKITDDQKHASEIGPHEERTTRIRSYKIPKISRTRENPDNSTTSCSNDETRKSPSPAKMPILEPQIDLNFELAARDTDLDYSLSPPVITKHERSPDNVSTPKQIEDLILDSEKMDSIEKKQDKDAVTFADMVSQLAYHEKATIRHRRYCILCERWFPTAARHRRHLTGYQHRHTELTQRRTVHALFMLFTGKPCPRLLPASIVRTDCVPGEPTPLQIAVQDVAISLEDGQRTKLDREMSDKNG